MIISCESAPCLRRVFNWRRRQPIFYSPFSLYEHFRWPVFMVELSAFCLPGQCIFFSRLFCVNIYTRTGRFSIKTYFQLLKHDIEYVWMHKKRTYVHLYSYWIASIDTYFNNIGNYLKIGCAPNRFFPFLWMRFCTREKNIRPASSCQFIPLFFVDHSTADA